MLGLAAIPALLVLPLLANMPDTARWYLFKDRVDDARKALLRVEPNRDVEQELTEIADAMREERGGFIHRDAAPAVFACHRVRRRASAFFAELSGINGIIYYSPLLFQAMGFEGNFSLLVLPALIQLASLAAVLASLVLVDRDRTTADPAVRHRRDDPRRRGAHRRVRREIRRGLRTRLRRAVAVHHGVQLRLRRTWSGSTPARASRPTCGRWVPARCLPPT